MYTEILRIIEGGLNKDIKKINNYARILADKLEKDGDGKLAKLIINALDNKPSSMVSMDSLLSSPVDQESRMSIVDITMPIKNDGEVVLPPNIANKVNDYINLYSHQNELIKNGLEISNSLLLYGIPGGGKTTIAKYIAYKTGLPLITARFDAIVSSLLGNTSKNIRKIFEFADEKPCILFLDEFDAIAKARDDQYELGELKRVINSLLQNIDTFSKSNLLIAATNHPELLDKAIWRRFNTVIEVGLPNQNETERLVVNFIRGLDNDFLGDEKKLNRIIHNLEGKTPSFIKTLFNNILAQKIIRKKETLSYEDVLIEIFESNHKDFSNEELIVFLNESGISQERITQIMNISIRQVRNNLKTK
ncbi:ATP-binding protein [Chryseobacterium wangxinyae]|uniref:AAA family ATPase n=1 Tax=Chryseobacterium sp. CY350 TaxID=2997336 RepID=UPI002270CCEF|nr:ATP-binding protein [Chryseobacterium sp. CY350]MCY0977184.1 ATP-binding protein [Chryseobacterium sp. CY350]WBZ95795.1 ATP-binding protein [Chryseobacterium sp. CY350]